MQWTFTTLILVGAIAIAVGGFGSTWATKTSAARDKAALQERLQQDKNELQEKLHNLQESLDRNTSLVFKAMNIKVDNWTSFTTDTVPPGFAEFLLLLFRADNGLIRGKVRVKDSETETPFSTDANDNLAIAVPNVWDAKTKQYRTPTVVEIVVTHTTNPNAQLSVLTAGWIDSMGREPR